jgi:HK97 family phage major capsid protein
MDKLQEIEVRKAEIKALLEDETQEIDVTALDEELRSLKEQEMAIRNDMADEAEERKLQEQREIAKDLGNKAKEIDVEERKVEKFTIASPEYRMAWAKSLMGLPLDETEKRAVGDAVTSTATTFVAADETHVGVNNGGLLIPTDVRTDILKVIEQQSPFYRDVKKLAVKGNISLPYLDASDDAEWYAELTNTKNEGQEYKSISLVGHELAKNVVVTWKLEAMAPEDFISFISAEIAMKMGKALVAGGILYGNGTDKATGALNGLTAVEGADPIAAIIVALKSLADDFKIGAKAYISTDTNIDMVGYQDKNGGYPFINGVAASKLLPIEVEPFLTSGDILVGNPQNYILNVVEGMTVVRETSVVGRKTTYGAYQVCDGKPRPGAFAKAAVVVPAGA